MRSLPSVLLSTVFAFTVMAVGAFAPVTPVAAATLAATTTCSNGVDNTPGLGLICEVTIENTITPTGGSAVVTVRECHGAAGDPEASCTTETVTLTAPVTDVNQCNDAINGGGGTLRCSVEVTNRYVGLSPTITAATVNQCVGSGDGLANDCDPFPATTTGATIAQCNGSANGGTLVGLDCTATGTVSDLFDVSINQCNNSTNGGGGLVICSANIISDVVAASTPAPSGTPAPSASTTPSGSGAPSLPPTDAANVRPATGVQAQLLIALTVVLTLGALALARRTATTRGGRRNA